MALPKVDDKAKNELNAAVEKFEDFASDIRGTDINALAVQEVEEQTKLSTREKQKEEGFYLKPVRTIMARDKFNEKFRDEYNFRKTYVKFIAENHEIVGETIDIWTRAYGGTPAEEWIVPTNKVVVGPRYLAEQIERKSYVRQKMDETQVTEQGGGTQFYGRLIRDTRVQRLSARAVKDSVTVGFASNF